MSAIVSKIKKLIQSDHTEKIIELLPKNWQNSIIFSSYNEELEILTAIIESYIYHFDFKQPYPLVMRALEICDILQNDALKPVSLIQNAYILNSVNLTDKALEQIHKAMHLCTTHKLYLLEASALHCLSQIYAKTGLYAQAMEVIEKALHTVRQFGESKDIAKVLQTYAVYLQGSNRIQESFTLLYEAIDICTHREDNLGLAICFGGLAYSYGQNKEFQHAHDCFFRALALEESLFPVSTIRLASLLKGIALTYAALKKYDTALEYARKVLALCSDDSPEIVKQYAYVANSSVLNDMGLYKEAFEFYRSYHQSVLKDRTEQAQTQVQFLHIYFDTERKQKEMELATLKAEKLENEINLKKNQIRLKQNQVLMKQNELTASALQIAQKNTMLMKLDSMLQSDYSTFEEANDLIQKLREEIRQNIINEQSWKSFEKQFKRTHHGFNDRLLKKYPSLSPLEVKICSMIALELSSKDIAAILCVEVSSVEVYRYRIRKKLHVASKDALHAVLVDI